MKNDDYEPFLLESVVNENEEVSKSGLFNKIGASDETDGITNGSTNESEKDCVSIEDRDVQSYEEGINNKEPLWEVYQNSKMIFCFSEEDSIFTQSDRYKIELEEIDVNIENNDTAMVQHEKIEERDVNIENNDRTMVKHEKMERELQKKVLLKELQIKRMAIEKKQKHNNRTITKLQKEIDEKGKEMKRLKIEIQTIDEHLNVLKKAKEFEELKKEMEMKIKKVREETLVDDVKISNFEAKCALLDLQLTEATSDYKTVMHRYDKEHTKGDRKYLKKTKKKLESRIQIVEEKNEVRRNQLEDQLVLKESLSRQLNKIKEMLQSDSRLECDEKELNRKEECEVDYELTELEHDSKKSLNSETLKYYLTDMEKMRYEVANMLIDLTKESNLKYLQCTSTTK